MQEGEYFKRIKPVDITEAVTCLDELAFIYSHGSDCYVTVPNVRVPRPIQTLAGDLGLGGTTARLFCRKLAPRMGIAPHVDEHDWIKAGNIRRFHVPLITHPDIIMRWPDKGVQYHLEPGYLYEVNYWDTHEIVNETDSERIHIQIDQNNATIN